MWVTVYSIPAFSMLQDLQVENVDKNGFWGSSDGDIYHKCFIENGNRKVELEKP